MRNSIRNLFAAAAIAAVATPLIGGGLFVLLGNPEASPEALAKKAVLTLKLAGCHEPEKATIVGTAIGDSGGRRTSIPLKIVPLSTPGMYAVTQQWPSEGRWALQFVGRHDSRVTTTVVAAGPGGIDRQTAKSNMAEPSEADITALLTSDSAGRLAKK